ncbi:cytochrome d ubiquinol oxidase subunit II [Candidatus Kaiserbacteria bacterium]|nr:cytochrome d ubiquinol oxidase subunit II [Candidatus Kaiserbacteria bacterium]
MIDLPTIWFLILGLELALYVILDGADLGLGFLSLLPQSEKARSILIQTVGPIWDANETWLVIAGGTLFGAFPLAYGIILNALYIPVMILLFGLIIRATAFEFRAMGEKKRFWETMFGVGSLLAIVGQGFAVGGVLNGIQVVDGHFSGGSFDWFSALSIFITAGVLMSYVVVGYAYLIKRRHFEYTHESFSRIFIAATVTFGAFASATILLPQEHPFVLERWITEPTRTILIGLSILIGLVSFLLIYCVIKKTLHRHLHSICMTIFVLAAAATAYAVYPYLIPPALTVYDTSSSAVTLRFMLWGIGPLLPIVLAYNFYMYHVFRAGRNDEHLEDY